MPALEQHTLHAERLVEAGCLAEAEAAYRAALALNRLYPPAALGLAHILMVQKRPRDAAAVTSALAALPMAPVQALEMHTHALVASGQLEDALIFSKRAAASGSPNAALGSAQLAADLGRFGEAEAGFRQVLARNPDDERARRGLARALFAGPAGIDGAIAATDDGLARRWTPTLALFKISLLNQAFRYDEAFSLAKDGLARAGPSPEMYSAAAAAAALAGQPEQALAYAESALRLAPREQALAALLAETRLGVGDTTGALQILEALRRTSPLDQKHIALTATALRISGDPRAQTLYDYERFVRPYTIEPPAGWTTLDAFLGDLKSRLNQIHDGQGETLGQSVRGGTQTNVNLVGSTDPLICALFSALEAPIADYVACLPRGSDPLNHPLAARNTGAFAFGGAWTVRLRPGGGHHVPHIHQQGWLSSACYIDLPEAVRTGAGEEGWIHFGEPGVPTRPVLTSEHKVRPEPGRLVLFPSYMWHGARPFGGDQRRLTFAFDVVPVPV